MSCPSTFGTITAPVNAAVLAGSPPMNQYTSIWFQLGSRPSTASARVTLTSLVITPTGLPEPSNVFHVNQTEIWYTPANWTTRQQIRFPMYRNRPESVTKISTTKFYLVRFIARVTWGSGPCFNTASAPVANLANVTVLPAGTTVPGCLWTPSTPHCFYPDL